MREKLRGFFKPRKDGEEPGIFSKLVQKFNGEMKGLIEGCEMPKPLEYYAHIFEEAFKFLKENPQQL